MSAFSTYVVPVSGGNDAPGTAARLTSSTGRSPSRRASSRTLPALRVARTTRRFVALPSGKDPLATRVERTPLQRDEALNTGAGQSQQRVEPGPAEWRLLRGALDLNDLSGTGHHDVHVDGRAGVLEIVEVEHGHAAGDADADGGDTVAHGCRGAGLRERIGDCHEAAGDGRRPRAAVGLDDVAIDPDRPLAHLGALDDRAQRAAHEPLDLLRAAARAAVLTRRARVRRAREHRVLGRDPAQRLAFEERRHLVLDRRRADHLGGPELDEDRAFGMQQKVARQHDGSQLIGRAPVGTRHQRSRGARALGDSSRARASYFFLYSVSPAKMSRRISARYLVSWGRFPPEGLGTKPIPRRTAGMAAPPST